MKNTITLCILSFLIAQAVAAQDVRTSQLTWSVNQLTDINKNVNASYSCLFKTDGISTIIWDQSNDVATMTVKQADGQWNDVRTSGKITYTIEIDGETGTIVFERTAAGVFITLDISQQKGGRLRHRYSVSKVTTGK